jgi:hypothetical protein
LRCPEAKSNGEPDKINQKKLATDQKEKKRKKNEWQCQRRS